MTNVHGGMDGCGFSSRIAERLDRKGSKGTEGIMCESDSADRALGYSVANSGKQLA